MRGFRVPLAFCLVIGMAGVLRAEPRPFRSVARLAVLKGSAEKPGSPATWDVRADPEKAATYRLLLGSRFIVEKAVKKHRLDDLPSLKNVRNAVEFIEEGLSTVAVPNAAPNVMEIRYDGTDANDCRVILSAVIDDCCQQLKDIYLSPLSEREKLQKAGRELRQQQATKEAAYAKFKREKKPGPTALDRNSCALEESVYRDDLERTKKLLTQLDKRLEEVRKWAERDRQDSIHVKVLSPPTPGARK